jgi:hypothetical protein
MRKEKKKSKKIREKDFIYLENSFSVYFILLLLITESIIHFAFLLYSLYPKPNQLYPRE